MDGAKAYARENGAKIPRGLPGGAGFASYRHMGHLDMFERAGFAFVKNAGLRRRVMTLKL